MPELDLQKFLSDLSDRQIRYYAQAVEDLVVATATKNKPASLDARTRLGEIIAETMGVAEIVGATGVLQEAAGVIGEESGMIGMAASGVDSEGNYHVIEGPASLMLTFANTPTQTILPRVTFEEAVEDLIDRTPTVIRSAAERTAQNIARLYGDASGGIPRIAFVRSAEVSVTKHVQGMIATAVREGIAEVDAGRMIAESAKDWSESYSRMAFRTNVNTAATAGRFRQAQDPDIMGVLPAMEFMAVGDSDTRHNHGVGDGTIMLTTNKAWSTHSPPLGYNCRCTVRMVGVPELRRMNRVRTTPTTGYTRVVDGLYVAEDRPPSGWHADDKFRHGGRPDLMLSGL